MEICNFELAKKLKEKGFDKFCENGYFLKSGIEYSVPNDNSVLVSSIGEIIFNTECCWFKEEIEYGRDIIYAPTISQALKWLREEKKIHIKPCILADADTDADGKVINEFTYWSFSIISIANGDMIYFEYEHIDDKRFDSYEQSALAGVNYCLDNLI